MNCKCGFKFAGPGEFRNCEAFIINGQGGVTCPTCGKHWLNGTEIKFHDELESRQKPGKPKGVKSDPKTKNRKTKPSERA